MRCPLRQATTRAKAEDSKHEPVVDVPPPPEDTEHEPFLEPAVRSFALGFGAGVLLELGHVLTKLTSVASSAGVSLPVLPEVLEQLTPLVAWDNLLAITCCALFYGLEVKTVLSVQAAHPNDSKQAAAVLKRMPTLPKRLMPVKLSLVKNAIFALRAVRQPALAVSMPQTLAFLRGPGAAVVERPGVRPAPPLGAPGGPLPPFPGSGDLWDSPSVSPRVNSPTPKAVGTVAAPRKPVRLPGVDRAPERLAPGAWDPAKGLPVSKRAQQLRDRRAYLKNCWYAAALSSSLLPGKPLEVKLLGRTVVLFRDTDTGAVKCLDNLCPHRGAPLGQGWVRQVAGHSCVVCPYHGWAFDGTGRVREVPSLEQQDRLPKRPLLDVYPIEERGGFLWLFFGSSEMPVEERPPIPYTPELDHPLWQAVYGEMEFDAPHWSVFDNALDMAHIHYLHNDSFGNSEKPVIKDMQLQRDTFEIKGTFSIHNKPVNALWEWTAVESVPVQYQAMLPSTSCIKITLGAGVQMITFVNTVPINAHRSVNRFVLVRNFLGWEGFDVWARQAMFKILGEDKVMVEQLRPEGVRSEVSLEPDLPQLAFRRLRQGWVDQGYLVDPEATEGYDGSLDM